MTSNTFHQDVLVVGAGPAGCTAALLLARSGVNVTLIERHSNLDREFRGPAYQPSVLRIWDELGLRDEIFSLDHKTFDSLSFVEEGKTLFEMHLGGLPSPYNKILTLKQAELLRLLIRLAAKYPNFTYISGAQATALHKQKDGIAGVVVEVQGKSMLLTSRLVLACDGRFSVIRKEANIPLQQVKQRFDILWFEIPSTDTVEMSLNFHLTSDGLLLQLPKEGQLLQVGFILAKESYKTFRKKTVEEFREIILKIAPELRPRLETHLTNWNQCALLDVKVAMADYWTKDGLLLLGDAAHIASPVGALGNKLAIEDAVLAHPVIMKALNRDPKILKASSLNCFETARRPDIALALRLQRTVGKIFLESHSKWFRWIRSWIIPIVQRSPFAKKMRKIITLSPHPVHVDTSWFKQDTIRHYHTLIVKEIIQETDDTKTFVFESPDLFQFKPGQFLTLRAWVKGKLVKRCYSISSSNRLQVTVKRVKNGLFSNYMHDEIKQGNTLLSLPPVGSFTAGSDGHHHIFLAGGSGITPVMALIESILTTRNQDSVAFLDVNSSRPSIIFKDQISKLLQRYPERFQVTHYLTQENENGHPTMGTLSSWLNQASDSDQKKSYYLCGPMGLMDTMKYTLKTHGVNENAIHIETFSSLKGVEEARSGDSFDEVSVGDETEKSNVPPKQIVVELKGKAYTIPYYEGDTLLDATLKEGLDAPFSCKEGICGTCLATLQKGYISMDKHDALRNQDLKKGKILTCQAKPHSKECSFRFGI